jgi:hypothetical protein
LRDAAPDADVHGWRSTLSTWATDNGWPMELADASIQHAVGSKVARVYMRSDLLERRAPLLDAWANFLIGSA